MWVGFPILTGSCCDRKEIIKYYFLFLRSEARACVRQDWEWDESVFTCKYLSIAPQSPPPPPLPSAWYNPAHCVLLAFTDQQSPSLFHLYIIQEIKIMFHFTKNYLIFSEEGAKIKLLFNRNILKEKNPIQHSFRIMILFWEIKKKIEKRCVRSS